MSKYEALFSPIQIGGITVKNRIMMPAMDTNNGTADGEMTDRIQAYLTERARGGTGLITIEATSVSYPAGRIGAYQLRMDDVCKTAKWADAIRAMHSFGAKVIVQLHHGGIQAVPAYCGNRENVCASDFSMHRAFSGRAMTLNEIEQLRNDFIVAAQNVRKTGADGVEIHAAHMYLLNSFLSPFLNKRTDDYGGSLENRGRLLREIVEGVRKACPRPFIISVRLPACDFVPGGQTMEEGAYFAKMCEEVGADLINVSTGIAFSPNVLTETQFEKEGNRIHFGKAMKDAVSIPVATVGKLRTAAFCNEAILNGMTDLVAIGRQLICDPEWPNKNLFGREENIRPCLSCNAACVSGYSTSNVQCVLNPFVSHELMARENSLPIAAEKKNIIVIGGGVAGMQFAIMAKKRGHTVKIIEKSDHLGGQMKLAGVPPHKEDVKRACDWFIREVKRLNIPVETEKSYTADELALQNVDSYVIAAGAAQKVLPIPGIENAHGVWSVLDGSLPVAAGATVAIIGGGAVSCETAEYLIEKGCNVSVVEILPELMRGYEFTHKRMISESLQKSGKFTAYCSAKTKKIDEQSVIVEQDGADITLKADLVLYSTGNVSCGSDLYEGLIRNGKESYLIGDALSTGDIRTATRSAFELALNI